jgi:thiol-disulfide isomerase/thioredoxin
VTVWASWYLPCREDAPLLARLARTYEGTIDLRGINVEIGAPERARVVGKQPAAVLRRLVLPLAEEAA